MDKIIQNLKSPEWWFTALIIATFASLIAAYVKDWIPRLTSHFSSRMKRRRQRNLRRLAHRLYAIREQPILLVMQAVFLLLRCFGILVVCLLGMTIPMFSHFYAQHPDLDFGSSFLPHSAILRCLAVYSAPVYLATSVYLSFSVPRASTIVTRGYTDLLLRTRLSQLRRRLAATVKLK